MADWKLLGIVPDSDEEDELDSQENESFTRPNHEICHDGNQPAENEILEKEVVEEGPENQDSQIRDFGQLEKLTSSPGKLQILKAISPPVKAVLDASCVVTSLACEVSPRLSVDKFHGSSILLGCDGEDTTNGHHESTRFVEGVSDGEEISRSYVRITSPTSTQLSSPPASQLSLPPFEWASKEDEPSTGTEHPQQADTLLELLEKPALPSVRRFRERKPIQIHPYVMEHEKYKRTVKAGGLAPVRIASSQDDGRRKSHNFMSPDQDSSQQEVSQATSFGVGAEDAMDIDWDVPFSSPPASILPPVLNSPKRGEISGEDDNGHDDDDDEDLPDLKELLRRQKEIPKKRKIRSYSAKHKYHRLAPIQTQSMISEDIFDVPDSPPITSSPHAVNNRRIRASLSRLSSVSSTMNMSSLSHPDTPQPREKPDLPTPATSASRPLLLPDLSDTSSESEAPGTRLQDEVASVSSSSDEEVAVRRIKKRFRGVLPASHLRLNQQRNVPQPSVRNRRESQSLSPVKGVARRGLALPKFRDEEPNPPSPSNGLFSYLSDDSREGSEAGNDVAEAQEPWANIGGDFGSMRSGLAEENDHIDAMMPSRKRLSSHSRYGSHKKRRGGTAVTGKRQPRITEHLRTPVQPSGHNKLSGRTKSSRKKRQQSGEKRHLQHIYPRLGILDLPSTHNQDEIPNFIKLAARTARQKRGQGRQSPSRKFIRLATREDTQDVQSVLDEWREGTIRLHQKSNTVRQDKKRSRHPLQQIHHNRLSMLPDTVNPRKLADAQHALTSAMPRKIQIARSHQQSMHDFVSRSYAIPQHKSFRAHDSTVHRVVQNENRQQRNSGRPAQLELSEVEHSHGYSATAFRSTKKTLDALYRTNRRRPVPQANIQLSRFLEYDDEVVQQSIESDHTVIDLEKIEGSGLQNMSRVRRVKKRIPQRLDASAARYRQPSIPLIVDYLIPMQQPVSGELINKLTGLSKLGTRYTSHFNIFPLQLGIFFHPDTLIGQGRLYETLREPDNHDNECHQPFTLLRLGDQTFAWGEWDEVVSSEIGISFDWVMEQLLPTSVGVLASDTDVVDVLSSVLEYICNHAPSKQSLNIFLSRFCEVLGDFSSRLRTGRTDAQKSQDAAIHINVLSVCALVTVRLLLIARANNETISQAWNIESLLKDIATLCMETLLAQGFETVLKLYDDLQYLSFREVGIKKDQYVAQTWIILIKTLAAANIPRASFWDLLSPYMLQHLKKVTDLQVLEKTWYSLFSILPLCEFKKSGNTAPGLCQTLSFDGWRIPQHLIKQVTGLYEMNQKQPPGFNDYCRSLFARCHYLMTQWGWWKCATVIGSLFDFFASQQLAHLRNEEVNVSPRFLGELDTEPSLDVEPEDRCFHIFLKMVALAIKRLIGENDMKGIRNLVARLLPNHNRQFSKNEAIHHRDIASLRNHHDLLCTMYWAAPAIERPALTLIQDLVEPAQSHNEACLINLRSWESLSRFIVATTIDEVSYKSLKQWQTTFFSGLCKQYLGQEDEVRQQAESLQHTEGEPMTESRITAITTANMRSTMVPMCVSMAAMGTIIKSAKSNVMLKQALNSDVISMALNPAIHTKPLMAEGLMSALVRALNSYIDSVDSMYPAIASDSATIEEDSQDSLDIAAWANIWERSELASQLQHSVLDDLSLVLRGYLESSSDNTKEPMLVYRCVECWARIVSLMTGDEKGTLRLDSFLGKGKYAIFEGREMHKVASDYWPLFLAGLLKSKKSLEEFKFLGFNLGLEWLVSLLKPKPIEVPEKSLSTELHAKGHYLCSHVDIHTLRRTSMIKGAIQKMSSILIEGRTEAEIGMLQRDAERLFADMLTEVMRTMQRSLESLDPLSDKHKEFVEMAQIIVADIKCYATDIKPLTDFFVHPSTYYWPPDTDPSLYGAGLVAYCIRLVAQPEKTSWPLFWYLHTGWKKALTTGSMANYAGCIRRGFKRWDFCKFMLAEFVPAVLSAGFDADGWVLCATFLPPVANHVADLLGSSNVQAEWVFEHMIHLMGIITNGIISHYRRRGSAPPKNRGVIAVAIKFWFAVAAPMRQYIERYPSESKSLFEVADPLTHFIWHSLQSFQSDEPEFWHPTGQLDVWRSKHHNEFVAAFEQDIKTDWEFEDAVGERVVVKAVRSKEKSPVLWYGASLKEILQTEIKMYRVLFPSTHEVPLSSGVDHFMNELYV